MRSALPPPLWLFEARKPLTLAPVLQIPRALVQTAGPSAEAQMQIGTLPGIESMQLNVFDSNCLTS